MIPNEISWLFLNNRNDNRKLTKEQVKKLKILWKNFELVNVKSMKQNAKFWKYASKLNLV